MHRESADTSFWIEIGVLVVLLILILCVRRCSSSNTYNNGICTACGGRYVYQQAVGHRHSTDYIYICDKCGRMITIGYYAGP